MSSPVGGEGSLGIVKENSFGAGGSVTKFEPILSESINIAEGNIYSDRIRDSAEQTGSNQGFHTVGGDVVIPVSPKIKGEWFNCALGQSTSPYYVERPLPSLMLQIDHITSGLQASGCMIESMNISSSQGAELQMTVGIQGKGGASYTPATASFTSGDTPYVHSEGVVLLNNIEDNSVTTWNVSIANNLVADLYGTSRQRIDLPAGKLVVTGSYTKLFDDVVERTAFLANMPRSFKARFQRGTNNLTIWLPLIKYDGHVEAIGGQSEYILENFNFTAYSADPASQYSIRISGDFS